MSFETEYQNWLGQENLELYLKEQLEKMTERTQIEVLDSEREYRYQCRVILESLDPDVVDEGKKESLRDKLISAPLPLQMMRLSNAVEASGFGRVKNVMVQRV